MKTIKSIEVRLEDLPLILKLKVKNCFNEYIVKPTKEGTGLFVNKKED